MSQEFDFTLFNSQPKKGTARVKVRSTVVCITEVVYVTIGNPAFCLTWYLTGVHFRGELQNFDHMGEQKIKCRPIRTREMAGVRLYGKLYLRYFEP